MKKLLKKIGLIKDFEIQFQVEADKAIELLISDKTDKKINLYDKVFGNEIQFDSTDFNFDRKLIEFTKNRESKINPKKGRAKIKFKLASFENNTCINGIIESYYSDLKFVFIVYGILSSLLTLAIITSKDYGFEWIFYLTGFFIFVTTFIILFQRFEANKAQKALMKYFDTKITNANK
ncbi:MAG: hypothetical protein Q8J88_06935 [Bacteroidales bacterium]|nr:hypothetical protein [Bacteroidales bacterium]